MLCNVGANGGEMQLIKALMLGLDGIDWSLLAVCLGIFEGVIGEAHKGQPLAVGLDAT